MVSFEHSFGKVWNIGVIFEPCISIMAFLFFNYIVFKGFVMAEKKMLCYLKIFLLINLQERITESF